MPIRSLSIMTAMGGAALAAALPLATPLAAQTTSRTPIVAQRGDHPFKPMSIGAGIGGALAVGYYFLSERGTRAGSCGPWDCALPYLSVSGALSGLFMAHELAAQRRAETPRVGATLTFNAMEVKLPSAPNSLGLRDSLIAVATDSGAQVMSTLGKPSALRRRGGGLSDVRMVALSGDSPRLFIGTGSALWETPTTTGLLSRVLEGPVDALAAAGNAVVSASGRTLRIRRTTGATSTVDTLEMPAAVTSASHDATSGHFWVTTDSAVFELTVGADKPVVTLRADVSGQARAVATSAKWIAVALGSDGLAIWPRAALTTGGVSTAPVLLRGEPRFAFDVAFLGDELYVAGGVDGVTHVELTPSARIVGSSRQVGMATAIITDGNSLWVADRSKNRLLKITP